MAKKKTGKIVDFSSYSGYMINNNIQNTEKEKKQKKSRKKNNRKIDNRKIRKGKVVVILLLLLALAIAYICLFTPLFNITKITIKYDDSSLIHLDKNSKDLTQEEKLVETYSKYSDNEIITISNIKMGNNIFKEDLSKSQELIISAPYIKNAAIARKFPGEVIIYIRERQKKAYIDYVGSYVCIDEEGYMLESIKKEEKIDHLPIITGITPRDIVKGFELGQLIDADDPIKIQRITNIFSLISKNELVLNIHSIDVSDKDNVNVTIDNGTKTIKFGDLSNMNAKIVYLKEILEHTKDKTGTIIMDSSDDDLKPIFSENIGG